jgi:hypothetical protein
MMHHPELGTYWLQWRLPNGMPISRRERIVQPTKMPLISCAKRSATAACWAADVPGFAAALTQLVLLLLATSGIEDRF